VGARDTLAALLAAGLRVDVVNDRLRVQPAELLTDSLRDAIRRQKPELIALLEEAAPSATPAAPRPAAGLASAWRSFMASAAAPPTTATRPYRLSRASADEAHYQPWSGAAIARFGARAASIQRRGFSDQDSQDLAELLHLLDVQGDSRVLCLGCRHLAGTLSQGWRCTRHRAAGLATPALATDFVTLPQRCGACERTTP
jgi:hypothetical protein